MRNLILLIICLLISPNLVAQIDVKVKEVPKKTIQKTIELRRDFHQFPELSNREFETGKKVANRLRELGIEVQTGIAKTGVKGILRGGKPGPVVALRADMDALPVTERVDLPFASKVRTTYLDKDVGVMHACGHDTHTASLLGAAEVLAGMREEIAGTIVFIFQPAEEGAPPGETGGAQDMVKEGILKNPDVDAAFGLHVSSGLEVGKLEYRLGGFMAASDRFEIRVKGKQSHGSRPWTGVDPIVTSAQIIMGLQTIVSRQSELTKEAVVISVGKIEAGVRSNIIPEEALMIGTIRTLDTAMQRIVHQKIRTVATNIAESMGATAEVDIKIGYPVTYNDPDLTRNMVHTLYGTVGKENVRVVPARTGAEDFSFYAQKVPATFVFYGGRPSTTPKSEAPSHHTPDFYVDEGCLEVAVRTYCNLALNYLNMKR